MTPPRLRDIIEKYPFARYLLVGGFGFIIDAGGLEGLVALSVNVYVARAFSMTSAIFVCYFLHRRFTFAEERMGVAMPETPGRFSAFVASQLFAAAVNYGSFCVMLWVLSMRWFTALVPDWFWLPEPAFFSRMGALCFGVGLGLVVNYLLVKKVFVHGLRLPRFLRGKD
ncbi:MAG: hypothetical protein GC185_12955 [Alphaproteobacteria bacterium]|nr:hypothetical protein [Alphaproteobacteria bacterium]